MYETKKQPVISRSAFCRRVYFHILAVFGLLGVSLGIGMLGYVFTEHMKSVDAFLNAAMLLGGMGPANTPATSAGKLFAGVFALYAGLLFMVCAAIVLTPILHRLLHRFHFEGAM